MGNSSEPDEALAASAAAGDRAAFEVIVQRHKEQVFRFIRRYVGNSEDAYDLLQETFLATWVGLRRYDSQRSFAPWLRTIALNKCRDFSRRQAVRRLLLRMILAEPTHHSADPHPVDPEAERLQRLDKAIAELPRFYKEPLLLTSVSGLSHQEAAKALNTTPKAVEMRLRRARQKLAANLAEQDREG